MLKQEIELLPGHVIKLKLTNAVKLNILDKFRSDLIAHLKKSLNNRQLKLETELLEEEAKKMIYTNKEKFDHLVSKRPILKELQNRLGLDPDF